MQEKHSEVIERFLRYIELDTQSDEESTTFPSTEKQKVLGRMLSAELEEMGASEVFFDETYGYVYAKLPASLDCPQNIKTLGFLAHMDTSPAASGKGVKPQFVKDYGGGDIVLNREKEIVLSPREFPELKNYIGQTLITTDGTTLLGSDDKSGVAEIMTMAHALLKDPSKRHGPIAIAFTPDEEVGGGVDHIDLERFGADFAYTVDGGAIGELEYENFNAARVDAVFAGVSVHPGEAKGKLKNAVLYATEFIARLPVDERPENTEGYEGFYFAENIKGDCEEARVTLILRDHDREKFARKKAVVEEIAGELNRSHGEGTVSLTITDSYYNMKEKIEPDNLFLIDRARETMEEMGITPVVQPIRGGTDGAQLSFRGIPCPNLCAGGHNFHGRFEYVSVSSMERITDFLIALTGKARVKVSSEK